jgi:hypothetical protein
MRAASVIHMRVGVQKSGRLFAVWLLCAAIFFAGFSFWLDRYGAPVLATVLNAEGKTTFADRNEIDQNPRQLSTASHLAIGEEVKTAPHEKVSLCLVPGIFVEVAEQTDVRIDELRLIKWGNAMVDAMRSRMAVLHLGKGTVRASLSNLGSGQYDLKIKTEAGMAMAGQRSLFTLQMEGATVRITCVQGEVSWNSARGKSAVLITAGDSCVFRSGDEAAGRLLPVSDDAQAQSEVVAALEFADFLKDRGSNPSDGQAPASGRR